MYITGIPRKSRKQEKHTSIEQHLISLNAIISQLLYQRQEWGLLEEKGAQGVYIRYSFQFRTSFRKNNHKKDVLF